MWLAYPCQRNVALDNATFCLSFLHFIPWLIDTNLSKKKKKKNSPWFLPTVVLFSPNISIRLNPSFICLSSATFLENLELIKFICNYEQYIFPRLSQYGVVFNHEPPRLLQNGVIFLPWVSFPFTIRGASLKKGYFD